MDANTILNGDLPGGWQVKRPTPTRSDSDIGLTRRQVMDPNNLYIAVMGITGAGKSTFISQCTGLEVKVGHGLKSETNQIKVYPFQYNGRIVNLIDTPGFDDTYRRDIDVLKDVSFWLNKTYTESNIQLTGIVYLHRISDVRLGGTARKDLQMFKKLCGEDSFASVVLGTTMWESIPEAVGDAREAELRTSPEFYGEMIRQGSEMMRHINNRNSAMNIINHLVRRQKTTVLKIQREMAINGASLDETDAGRELESEMLEQKKLFEERLREAATEMQIALESNDRVNAERLAVQQDELNKKIAEAQRSRDELRVDMERLFKEKELQFELVRKELEQTRKDQEKAYKEREKEAQQWKKSLADAEILFNERKAQQEKEWEEWKKMAEKAAESKRTKEKEALEERLREVEAQNRREKERMEFNMKCAQEEQQRKIEAAEKAAQELAAITQRCSEPPPPYSSTADQNDDDIVYYVAGAGVGTGVATAIALAPLAVGCSMM